MKKYIMVGMLVLFFPTIGYAKCCDCCKDIPLTYVGTMTITDTGIKKLIGKTVHRTKPIELSRSIADRSYINDPRKLLGVTDKELILSSDILASGQFEIGRDIWDDGNWEEVKPQRLTVTEAGSEISYTLLRAISTKYSCIRCGKRLNYSGGDVNYYCTSCKTGFYIKEE